MRRFIAFDVAEPTLRHAVASLSAAYPTVEVSGVVGDFGLHLDRLPNAASRLVAFLGSTIGNLSREERARFLATVAGRLRPGEGLLLGVDLVKDPARLLAAYDDAAGVTAEFEKNVLAVVNTALGADFDVDRFTYVARWDPGASTSAWGYAPWATRRCGSRTSGSRSNWPMEKRSAPRSAPSSAGRGSSPS